VITGRLSVEKPTFEDELMLTRGVKEAARMYAQTSEQSDLKRMVDGVCELVGLRFRYKVVSEEPSHSKDVVIARCKGLSDVEIGNEIVCCKGVGGSEFSRQLTERYADLMDLSIPTFMPILCDIFMGRLSNRFNLGSNYVATVEQEGGERQHIKIANIDGDRIEFNVPADEENRWFLPSKEIRLEGSGNCITLSAALSQMNLSYKTRKTTQQQMLI